MAFPDEPPQESYLQKRVRMLKTFPKKGTKGFGDEQGVSLVLHMGSHKGSSTCAVRSAWLKTSLGTSSSNFRPFPESW